VQNNRFTRHPLPFRYPGGKYYALGILRPFWLCVKHDEYREPLVGGGSVFFNKMRTDHDWLNDADEELIVTYRVMANSELRAKLIDLLSNEVASRERWREVYEFEPRNELEVAYRYFYLNRTSFSGKMTASAWGYRPKRSLPPERWHERIEPTGNKLEGVTLTSLDFESVIDAPSKGQQTLLYVDPPYFAPPKHKHYKHGFEDLDHIRLCQSLKNTPHRFFLTYDDVSEIRKLYNWANIYEVKFFYRVDNSNVQHGSRQVGFELVITNYELPNQCSLFKEI